MRTDQNHLKDSGDQIMEGTLRFIVVALAIALVSAVISHPNYCQSATPSIYDPQTVITVQGRVERLTKLPGFGPGGPHEMDRVVILKSNQGSITVHLGPAWYLSQKRFPPNVGDMLEVIGSKIRQNRGTVIVAKEVTKDGETLKLRDDQGFPSWKGSNQK
jgi:hypothetical protein